MDAFQRGVEVTVETSPVSPLAMRELVDALAKIPGIIKDVLTEAGMHDGDDLLALVAEALCDLIDFVEGRPGDATEDDDVRALENTVHVLQQVGIGDHERLIHLLGQERARGLGLISDSP